jgi:hypothetical protein
MPACRAVPELQIQYVNTNASDRIGFAHDGIPWE